MFKNRVQIGRLSGVDGLVGALKPEALSLRPEGLKIEAEDQSRMGFMDHTRCVCG